ncbi:LytTR family transcriptional regulator DNA-binding domain-containing protein [Larkinella rosea]|uniref:Response regulatory domain-containing protein n=1 Tax=Larkinella rosea TaxID=2025312 RepID=A0A3P1BV54_9BACT|nr:LytTR family transcriptional regulator DNA-binding domain-containing protein [Larkinella rosea]RRB04947.1 hypothetical protein EHT25_15935 [Larkinella rosea]
MGLIDKVLEKSASMTFLSGCSNYTWLHFTDGKKMLVSKSLVFFETKLNQFIRVHKTALINPLYVTGWQAPPRSKMAGVVTMICGTELPVGRRRWHQLVDALTTANRQTAFTTPVKEGRTVFLVTESATKGQWIQHCLESQFDNCLVDHVNRGEYLYKILEELPDHQLPNLILLDASTSTSDRLTTLRQLKQKPRMASIPTLVLVSGQKPETVNRSYAAWANSVVTVSEDRGIFTQTIKQVGRFWLTLAALPGKTGRPEQLPA